MILYPDTSVEEWGQIYDLDIITSKCPNCGKELIANIPFATKVWRGLKSKAHDCGPEYDLLVVAPVCKKERAELKGLFN